MSSDHFFSSTVITVPKRASRGPHNAGPSFDTFFPESVPEKRENQVIAAIPSSPRIPPPAILHPPPTPIPTNNTIPAPPLYGDQFIRIIRPSLDSYTSSDMEMTLPRLDLVSRWSASSLFWHCLPLKQVPPFQEQMNGLLVIAHSHAWWLAGDGLETDPQTAVSQNRNTRIDPESWGQRASNSEHLEQIRSHNPQQPPFPSINSPQTQNDHLPHTLIFRSRYGIYCSFALRNPMQNPQMIRQDIRKLPKNVVDRIPLVVRLPGARQTSRMALGKTAGTPSCLPRRQSCRMRNLSEEPKYENDELRLAVGDEGVQLLRLLRCGRETEKEEI
ncbi:hypothetical protein GG344DRAFT_61461 [Lentinula edodes]|nr:hypothetical protein GG344DRAFT_61461 [Lentinula edodes]